MRRTGSAALLIIILAVGAGTAVVATSPDTAQDILPASILPALPQFETVETDMNCTRIEAGTETANNWVPDALLGGEELQPAEVKDTVCQYQCGGEDDLGGAYCSSELLNCACRADT